MYVRLAPVFYQKAAPPALNLSPGIKLGGNEGGVGRPPCTGPAPEEVLPSLLLLLLALPPPRFSETLSVVAR